MPTQRRTLKTPPAKAARKLFKTVPQYLEWIRNSQQQIREKEYGSKKGVSKLIRQVISRLLIRARANDATFREHFEMPDGFPRRVAVQKLLICNKPRDYTLRLPINQTVPIRLFQLLSGHLHRLDQNEAMVCLNQSMTREVRAVFRRNNRQLLDEDDYVSPGRINSWLVPLLKKVVTSINHTDTSHYYVTTKSSLSKEGLTSFITFSAKDEKYDESFIIRLTFELCISVADLPKTFKVRNPFSRDIVLANKNAKGLVKEIKQSFAQGDRRLLLHCAVSKTASGLPDISQLHGRAKAFIEYSIDRCGTAFTTKSLPMSLSQVDISGRGRNPRVWEISYDAVECIMFDKLCQYSRFRSIQRAFTLYDVIASCGNRVLPKLNKKTKRAISLWLFKQGGNILDEMHGAFVGILEIVRGCVSGNFCPSFCQMQVNTMSPVEDEQEEFVTKPIYVPEDDDSSDDERNERQKVDKQADDSDDDDLEVKEEKVTDPRSNIDKLLQILYEDNIRKAVYLINIC